MRARVLSLAFLIIASASAMFAGNTGKIAGRVIDNSTKEPLIGVNVVIPGTVYGAATDIDGRYTILNLPPNTYILNASLLGYDPVTVQNVQVSIDLTTTQDFQLSETVLEQKEVVIVAERPLVQNDLTAKTAVVSADKIQALPVTEVSQVLNLQAGVVAGRVRGGRSGELAYWIDGVPVTDAFNGSQVVEVNKSLIQELQLVSGAFNAEYGQAMSGIVNIATKEGGSKYTGGLGFYAGDYLSSDDRIFPGIDDINPVAIRNFEGNLSGPLLGDKLTFFANARYIYFDGYLSGFRRFNPWNIAFADTSGNLILRDSNGRGDSARVPMNWSERWYGQGKLTWRIAPMLKANYNFIYDRNHSKPFKREYFYNPDGVGTDRNISYTNIMQLTHTLNSNTFYTLGGSAFFRELKYSLYDTPNDPRYVHPDLSLPFNNYSYLTGGNDLSRFKRKTNTFLGKVDLSSQLNQTNLVKIGAEFRKHEIEYENISLRPIDSQANIDLSTGSPFIETQVLDVSSVYHDQYKRNPTEISGYIQDKLEFRDFIVNVGVRWDYFEPDGVTLIDPEDPNIFDPLKPSNRFFDYNSDGNQDPDEPAKTVADRQSYWYKKAKAKSKISPRFGASFPITAGGVVHFSYGHFFQIPRFERLYENPGFKLGAGTGNQGVVGNADLEPEQTVNGEIGMQQQVSDDIFVDITVYMRDIRNLTGTRADEIVIFGGSKKYSRYVNSDFGLVKGIVLTFDKRFLGGFAASVDYTYQVAEGTASDPSDARNSIAGNLRPEVTLVPLGWDQRHTLNVTGAYNGPIWGLSAIGQFGSGQRYTLSSSEDITSLETNRETKPAYFNLDLRAHYEISFSAFRTIVFARIFNIFDTRNAVDVFPRSGSAAYTPELREQALRNQLQPVNSLNEWFTIPTFYSEPRRVEFGVNLEF